MNVIETARWGQQPTNQDAPAPPALRRSVWLGTSRFWPVGSLAIAGAIPWVAYQALLGHHPFSYDGFRIAVLVLAFVLTCAHACFMWVNNRALWWPVASISIALSGFGLNSYFTWLDQLILWLSIGQVAAYILGQALIYEYVCGIPVSPHHKVKLRAVGQGRWVPGSTSFDWGHTDFITGESPGYRVRSASDYEVASESFGRRGDHLPTHPLHSLATAAERRRVLTAISLVLALAALFLGLFTYDEEVTIASQGYHSLMLAPVVSAPWILVSGVFLVAASMLRRGKSTATIAATSSEIRTPPL